MSWLPKESVVVPVDFSDESFAAVDVALEMVAGPEHLHVIHVLAELVATEPGVIWEVIDEESRREHAREALAGRLADARYAGIDIRVDFGDPGHRIAEFAARDRRRPDRPAVARADRPGTADDRLGGRAGRAPVALPGAGAAELRRALPRE